MSTKPSKYNIKIYKKMIGREKSEYYADQGYLDYDVCINM